MSSSLVIRRRQGYWNVAAGDQWPLAANSIDINPTVSVQCIAFSCTYGCHENVEFQLSNQVMFEILALLTAII